MRLFRLSVVAVMFTVFLVPPVSAGLPYGATHEVEAAGEAFIYGNDKVHAREEAISAARAKALEKVLGVYIASETLVMNGAVVSDFIKSKTKGYIASEEVISVTEDEEAGVIRAVIRAEVGVDEKFLDELASLASCNSIMVLFDEEMLGKERKVSYVGESIISHLTNMGYSVIDFHAAERSREISLLEESVTGDQEANRKLRLRYLSDVLISGNVECRFSSDNMGYFKSCHTDVHVKIIDTTTGQVICEPILSSIKGFGDAEEKAAVNSLKNAADALIEKFDEMQCMPCEKRSLQLILHGLADYDEFVELRNMIEHMRFVEGVEEESYSDGVARFRITYREKSSFLCNRLQSMQYAIKECSGGRIEASIK